MLNFHATSNSKNTQYTVAAFPQAFYYKERRLQNLVLYARQELRYVKGNK
jgi:hypothetical protein